MPLVIDADDTFRLRPDTSDFVESSVLLRLGVREP